MSELTDVVHLLAGGLSGVIAKSSVAPLDRVKILYQTLSKAYPNNSVAQTLSYIYKNEGVKGLWRGNWSSVVRIYPYAAIQFAAFERFKRLLKGEGGTMFFGGHFLAGSMAGATAVLCTYPLDVVRARLAYQFATGSAVGVGGEQMYTGVIDALKSMYRTKALYSGIGPTLYGIIPYAGTNFLVFEEQKALWVRTHPGRSSSDIPTVSRLVMGAVAGAVGQTITYPLDVVRRRMQVIGMPQSSLAAPDYARGTFSALARIYSQEGLRGWFRGISLNYLKVAPMVAISFTVFDSCKTVARDYFHLTLKQ